MPFLLQLDQFQFPDAHHADENGLLAIGGDLHPHRILNAYRNGIFPWYSELPIKWYAPDPRMVLPLSAFHAGQTLQKKIKKKIFEIRYNTDFRSVIEHCAEVRKSKTWITSDMIDAYCRLHEMGVAHSVETYLDNQLAGGIYGISVGSIFSGESMFYLVPEASKVALYYLIQRLLDRGFFLLDCQVYTENMQRFGAFEIPRVEYLKILQNTLNLKNKPLF